MNHTEVEETVNLLQRCEPGKLPPEIFEAIGRIAVYPAIEFIPLRRNGEKIEVLLLKRPEEDLIWPSMLHTPGTILRPTDANIEDAFARLFKEELFGTIVAQPTFIDINLSINLRGRCLLLEYLVEVKGDSADGMFFDVGNLPEECIKEQIPSIYRAVDIFRHGK